MRSERASPCLPYENPSGFSKTPAIFSNILLNLKLKTLYYTIVIMDKLPEFQNINEFINTHYLNKNTHRNITRAFKIFEDNFKGDLKNPQEVIEYSKELNIHKQKALLSLMTVYHNKQIPEYTEELKKTNQTVNTKTLKIKMKYLL